MARRRTVQADDDLAWSSHAQAQLRRAAAHGFREDAIGWTPPELGEKQPTRDWCAAFYRSHRDRIVDKYDTNTRDASGAWAIATFESAGQLQTDAAARVKERAKEDAWLREHSFDVWLNE